VVAVALNAGAAPVVRVEVCSHESKNNLTLVDICGAMGIYRFRFSRSFFSLRMLCRSRIMPARRTESAAHSLGLAQLRAYSRSSRLKKTRRRI
jgi:hypothetical protein